MDWNDKIRKLLRESRDDAGFSARQLAEEIGKGERTIRRIEAGHSQPPGEVIDRWLLACSHDIQVELVKRW